MTKNIQQLICKSEVLKGHIPCENVKYLFSDWELDVISLNKNGFLTEFEVKVSLSDFKADFKKSKWKFYNLKIESLTPNYFYYVCPSGLINEKDLPKHFGLIYVSENVLKVVKKANFIHKNKHEPIKILKKFLTVKTQRQYLGGCLLTIKNKV